jgi:predicted amidohydrolase YtcJ
VNLAFVGGRRYVTGVGSRSGGVAVRNGRIVAVGTDAEVRRAAGPGADVVDLAGGLVSPSFGDAHLHPTMGGVQQEQCSLDDCTTADECVAAVAAYAAAHPELPWILGGGWSMALFAGGTPHKALLDRVVPDRPVLLRNCDQHGSWANSRALEIAGITRDTPDPADGRIERDAHGEPSGTLHEGAALRVAVFAPPPTLALLRSGLLRGQSLCHSVGISHWQDALLRRFTPDLDGMSVYLDLARTGSLTARVRGALWWDRTAGLDQIEGLIDRRKQADAEGGRFRATAVKIMVDGVVENYTASLSRPYRDACGHPTDNRGISFIDRSDLREIVATVDAHDFQAHFHSLGDQAVTDALDAVAYARARNGDRGNRHHLAHLQVVRPDDVARFAELGAIANIQPLWAQSVPQMTELTLPFIDPELAAWQYPFGDLLRAGAFLAAGSDWPVSSANPIDGIHVAVNRTAVGAAEPFLPHQWLPLVAAWDAYTSGVAHVNGLDNEVGRAEPGYAADLVVLDRDPFEGPASEIGTTAVRSTWVAGNCRYER